MEVPPRAIVCIILVSAIAGGYIEQNYAVKHTDSDVAKDTKQNDVVTKIIEKPDGSKETTIVDKTKETHKETIITNKTNDWFIEAGRGLTVEVYHLSVNRRILGNIYVGAYGRTDKEVGLNIGMEF